MSPTMIRIIQFEFLVSLESIEFQSNWAASSSARTEAGWAGPPGPRANESHRGPRSIVRFCICVRVCSESVSDIRRNKLLALWPLLMTSIGREFLVVVVVAVVYYYHGARGAGDFGRCSELIRARAAKLAPTRAELSRQRRTFRAPNANWDQKQGGIRPKVGPLSRWLARKQIDSLLNELNNINFH